MGGGLALSDPYGILGGAGGVNSSPGAAEEQVPPLPSYRSAESESEYDSDHYPGVAPARRAKIKAQYAEKRAKRERAREQSLVERTAAQTAARILPMLQPRARESDKVHIQGTPTAMDWRGWRETLRHSVLAASNRGNDALEWIMRVEVIGCTFAELANSGEFETLDYKLHTALLNCIPKGPLKDKIRKAAETEIHERRAIKGRQTLFMIYEYYGGYQDAGAAATIRHLAEIRWMGDSRMQEFLNLWDKVIRAINVPPSEVDLRDFFLSNLRQSSVFVKELDEYEELPQEQKNLPKADRHGE